MTEDNSGKVSWFPYILVVVAILVIGFVVLSVNGKKKVEQATPGKANQIGVKDVTYKSLSEKDAKEKGITLPYAVNMKSKELFSVRFTLDYKAGTPTKYNFVFDDCAEKIVVNDKEIKLDADAMKTRCDWQKGVVVDLKDVIKDGANKVYVEGSNNNGVGGFNLRKP